MSTDPRKLPGSIVGPGGPHDRGGVVIDSRNAILLDYCMVSTVDPDRAGGQVGIAMNLSGRINRTQERASVLFLFGTDGAAGIVSELIALLGRAGAVHADALLADLTARVAKLRKDGNLQ